MATDSKRQSAAPKVPVALPKVDSSQQNTQTIPTEAALHAVIGSRVRLSTSAPTASTIEGTVYVADPITNLLVLNVSPTSQSNSITPSSLHAPSGSYRIIPISQITSFQIQSLPSQTSEAVQPPASSNGLDTAALQNRLSRSVAQQQAMQSRQGPKGTSPADQALFDAISRTMPTQWRGTSMVVSDTFIVDKPYGPANARFVEGANGDIERIKRVLDMERNKIRLKMDKSDIDTKMGSDGRSAMKKGG